LPSPAELPVGVIAIVSHVPPAVGTIKAVDLTRAISQSAADSGLKSTPAPGQPKYKGIEKAALGELLDGIWIQGQAREMRIVATRAQIDRELELIKMENFKTGKEYRAFLKRSHLSHQDVVYRVELQILSTKIQERVLRHSGGSPGDVQKEFAAFVDAYAKRWRARTVCAADKATERCSNGPTPEAEPPAVVSSAP
jgi:hypothetical protein